MQARGRAGRPQRCGRDPRLCLCVFNVILTQNEGKVVSLSAVSSRWRRQTLETVRTSLLYALSVSTMARLLSLARPLAFAVQERAVAPVRMSLL